LDPIRSFLGNDLQGAELDRFVHLVKELDIEDRMKSLKRIMYYSMPWGKKASTIQFNEVIQLVSKAIDNRIKNNSTEPDFFNFLIQELRTPQGNPSFSGIRSSFVGHVSNFSMLLIFFYMASTFITNNLLLFRRNIR
jgi:hypothetical protein